MSIKIANPLLYPIAVLAGGITLVVGVRFARLPSVVMLPVAAAIITSGASWLKSREPEPFNLDSPELATQLQAVRTRARFLAEQASTLRLEATKLLTDSCGLELLATVEYACDHAVELPAKIEQLAKRLEGRDALLSVSGLQQQLVEVQTKLQSSSGIAREHLTQLAQSLHRNIKLTQQGQDARQAQVVSLATVIEDAAGALQELQNKLRTADLTDSTQTTQLRSLSEQLGSFQESFDLLSR